MANLKMNDLINETFLKQAFDFYDENHKGNISIEDLKRVFGAFSDVKSLENLITEGFSAERKEVLILFLFNNK